MTQGKFSVRTEVTNHIGTITFACPPYNHVSIELLGEMANQLEALDADDACRVVLLQSEGKIFCAGADFNEGGDFAGDEENKVALALYEQAARLYSNRKPIIALVQGAAVGAGLGLALVADFRVASDQSRFSANFVKLGFHAGFAITDRLPDLIGQQKAARMLMTGERITGATALEWGLADLLVPADQLLQTATDFATQIAENAPLAIEATRQTLRGNLTEKVMATTAVEWAIQTRLKKTDDFAEGVKAVAERRVGQFTRS